MEDSKMKDICSVVETLVGCFRSEVAGGLANVDVDEAGKAADMIKDMTEADKNCWESKYYKLVCEAMEEGPAYENERMGYNHNMKEKPYIDAYMRDPDFERNMRYGYVEGLGGRSTMNEVGSTYNEYQSAKRHYTETKSLADKSLMDNKASEHMNKLIGSIKEIWADSDTSKRSEVKTMLKSLVDSMVV